MDAQQNVVNHPVDSNFQSFDPPGLSVFHVCEKKYSKKSSKDMRSFENTFGNVENADYSIPRIHFVLDDVLACMDNLEKKPESQSLLDEGIVNAVKEIRHELNIIMESSYAASDQCVRNIDAGNPDDHI